MDSSLDRRGLYVELRNSNNKMVYAFPRQVLEPDELLLVLKVESLDVLVLSETGKMGWITSTSLEVVSSTTFESAASE